MKPYKELSFEERKEVESLFAAWLKPYTHKVIVHVMKKRDEIIANDFVMNMLRELKKRQDEESADFQNSIHYLLKDFDNFEMYDPHSHVLEHAQSYRDVLSDMYIADRKRDGEEK